MRFLSVALAALALLVPAAAQTLVYENAFGGASFTTPIELATAPGEPGRAYIVEQGGFGGGSRIRTAAFGSADATTFIDLSDRVEAGGEQGLLGLAFHPDYTANGLFYVNYTAPNPLRTVVSEFQRSTADPLRADPASERVLLEFDQPFGNHNAGKLAFGPDGTLYIATGDGGSGGDPQNNAQTPSNLLGSLLRIDVDARDAGAYGIPADNPFVGQSTFRPETYAYGLRNPWKFSFDSATGDLWLADVGQGAWEEINLVEAGDNLGWKPVEGPACFVSGCDLSAYTSPIFAYPHNNSSQGGFSITGGFRYRGSLAPTLQGRYLYADFINPRLWALSYDGTTATSELLTTSLNNIAAINEGPDGEAYVVTYGGAILRVRDTSVDGEAGPAAAALDLAVAGANPFGASTEVAVTLPPGTAARLSVTDALGREVLPAREVLGTGLTQRLVLDGRDLAAGVYLVHVDAGADGAAVLRLVHTR